MAQELAVIKHQISQNTSLTQQGFASTSKGRKTRTVAGSLTAIGAIIIAVSEIIKVIVPAAAATNKQVPTHQVSP